MLLICGAPRGRTAPLPRILQRCCNPWSRDHTHARTRERAQHYCMRHAWTMRAQTGVISTSLRVCVDDYCWMISTRCDCHRRLCLCRCFVMVSQRKEEDVFTAHNSLWGGNLKDFNALFQCVCVRVCVIKVKAACDHACVCVRSGWFFISLSTGWSETSPASVYGVVVDYMIFGCFIYHGLKTLDSFGPIKDLTDEKLKQKIHIHAFALIYLIWCFVWIRRLIGMFGSDRL